MAQMPVIPMRLFATWEADRLTSSSCVPRVCTLTLSRLVLGKSKKSDLDSLIITVRLQGSKRSLRSNDIAISSDADKIDIDLDISFTVQYPHFVKKKNNMLVMLQRRKKYKNRTILGFKTLAVGTLNLTDIIQCSVVRELSLYSEADVVFAKLFLLGLSSQPIETEENGKLSILEPGDVYSEDEEEESTNEDNSDSEPIIDEYATNEISDARRAKSSRMMRQHRQRNFKQKIADIIKGFKTREAATGGSERHSAHQEIASLIEELENLSDSGPELEQDHASVKSSTPRPGLRPYFSSAASSKEALPPQENLPGSEESKDSESQDLDNNEDLSDVPTVSMEISVPSVIRSLPAAENSKASSAEKFYPPIKELPVMRELPPSASPASHFTGTFYPEVQQSILPASIQPISEQIALTFPMEDFATPPGVVLVSVRDVTSPGFLRAFSQESRDYPLIYVTSINDCKAVLNQLFVRKQKFCNSNNVDPPCTKVCLCGSDRFFNETLRVYTEVLAQKSSDWLAYVKFYVVNIGACSNLSRLLSSGDPTYASLMFDGRWKNAVENIGHLPNIEYVDLAHRVLNFLIGAANTLLLPIGEAMLQCKSGLGERDASLQLFVPFVLDVRVGWGDGSTFSGEGDSAPTTPRGEVQQNSPPSSPFVTHQQTGAEGTDLQIEYWTLPSQISSQSGANSTARGAEGAPALQKRDSGGAGKFSMKSAFRSLVISKSMTDAGAPSLCVSFAKEKKQQKMLQKLGVKSKEKSETEPRHQVVDNVTRLICSTSKQHSVIKVVIDGVEWSDVKYFQISAQWPTHVKTFPLAVWSYHEQAQQSINVLGASHHAMTKECRSSDFILVINGGQKVHLCHIIFHDL